MTETIHGLKPIMRIFNNKSLLNLPGKSSLKILKYEKNKTVSQPRQYWHFKAYTVTVCCTAIMYTEER